jgi:hypothetical protein
MAKNTAAPLWFGGACSKMAERGGCSHEGPRITENSRFEDRDAPDALLKTRVAQAATGQIL